MEIRPTDLLSGYIHRLRYENLPKNVVESAKLFLLDYLASAMAGYKINRIFNDALWNVIGGMGGKKESRVFFHNIKLPAPNAALLNAATGHGADMDDGNRTAQGHPGVAVIPVALALAEAHRLSGREAITAIVVGYDIFVRLATAINPSHLSRGFHTTGTVGTIAAGGAAAKALNLDLAKTRNALGFATLQAAGLLEVAESGQMAKPLHPAKAALNGILAARLSEAGAEGPREPLEGRKGFIRAFTDHVDLDILLKDLGKDFRISACYVKLYPACRHTHAAIDAASNLRSGGLPSPALLEKVKVYVYPAAINLTGTIYEPKSEDEAKFSLAYTVATALTKGNFTLQDLDVARSFDPETRALVSKIEIVSDPLLESRAANIRGARVELVMKNGTTRQDEVKLPKGEPEVPVTFEDIEVKMASCAASVFPKDRLEAIAKTIKKLDRLQNISSLTKMLIL
ncbi:MAG: MmgE/PrpD family protein [Deltaproteobacteria bacterium]|nr:MmgE/PrpD family protein [Deltaproteobacteria bacterium]